MIRFALRLAPVALALATGACFATRNDVRILQDDITKFRASQQTADSARAAQLTQVVATLGQVNDSLRATSARMARWQANAQGDIRNIQEQLVQIQELTGASQQLVGQAPRAAIDLLRWVVSSIPAGVAPHDLLTCRLADDQEHSPSAAIPWYEKYLSEAQNGAFTAEALGRRMVAVSRQSGRYAARDIAIEYLRRFPRGPHALVARELSSE